MKHSLPVIAIRGAGDLATGVALRLYRAGLHRLIMLETENPLAVRRRVVFSEAVYQGSTRVEEVEAVQVGSCTDIDSVWKTGAIPVYCDPTASCLEKIKPEILIDAIIAKKNLGTTIDMAPLVLGLGPGFTAGIDVHKAIETKRGHYLGRVISSGTALPNTGIPGSIEGYTIERVYWAPQAGTFFTEYSIGDTISKGTPIGTVDGAPVLASISGIIRGLLRSETPVSKGTKLADIDPRATASYCGEVSDKALAIGGGVLEAIGAHLFSKG